MHIRPSLNENENKSDVHSDDTENGEEFKIINEKYNGTNQDEINTLIKTEFDILINQLSQLNDLHSICIDLINFPMECYNFYKYFNQPNSFISLENIVIFICKEMYLNNNTGLKSNTQ